MSTLRATGVLHSLEEKTWQSKPDSKGEVRRGVMPIARVKLSAFSYVELTVDDSIKTEVGKVALGDPIDLVVEVTSSGGYLRMRAVDFWPDPNAGQKPALASVAGGKG